MIDKNLLCCSFEGPKSKIAVLAGPCSLGGYRGRIWRLLLC